ncbi:MAG: serine/threonine-protein kinase [Planctomycetaceae bacterium]
MTTLAKTTDFVEHLQRSKLLSAERFDSALDVVAGLGDPAPMAAAKALVKAGFLTRLHATRLLEGRTRGFFINHYRIDDVLGSGGMGWVYIARDLRTDAEVALKMLCEQNENDAGLLTRFRLEAEAGLKLNHRAIIRTHDVGTAEGVYGNVHYMVMDLVRGVGIDEFVAMGGPIAWPVACHIARHISAGLQHAHRLGLVHRDLKPANVLVDEKSDAHILDFGLSLASQSVQDDEFSLTMIFGQDCLGTADYIAPEQARDSFHVDRRADLYSLGATLHFMLAGRVLFPDKLGRAAKLEAHWNEPPQPIRQLQPNVPEEIEQIVTRLLAKDPNDRFATAREVATLLKPFAKAKRVNFDFQQILDRRAAIARQREKIYDERSKRAATASSLSVCSIDSKAVRPSQAQMETTIRKDTEVNHSEPELKLPRKK